MKSRLGGLLASISTRLLVPLLGTMALVFVVYGLLSYRGTFDRWTLGMEAFALRTTELIMASGHNAMLLNQKDQLQETILRIAKTPAVAGVRIYDKEGTIVYGSDPSLIGTRVAIDNASCMACHLGGSPELVADFHEGTQVLRSLSGEQSVGVISPIANHPGCASNACHPSVEDAPLLGVLEVAMSRAPLESVLADSRRQLIWLTLVMGLVIGGMSIFFVGRFVRRPVAQLQEGIERIGHGDLDTRIPAHRRDEVGRLARSVNGMAAELKDARTELTGWSEKLTREVEEKTTELKRIQRQVLHMEKMASLGKLSATVAHEINNPLAGILNYAKLVERDLRGEAVAPQDLEDMRRYVSLICKETARCGDIVRNLLLFSKQSGRKFAPSSLNAVLERSLLLLRHHMEMSRVALESNLIEGNDEINCDADQIQQAIVALVMNAVEVMSSQEGGTLRVDARAEDEHLVFSISDTGGGIPQEILPNIFEPFFTTKRTESGSGLGLAVVFGIVQRHGGEIDVDTEMEVGTTFKVTLPRKQSLPMAGETAAGTRNEVA